MAAGNLSPRQKMINMMYLVLTALLALNVSKEVLNSFFEVNVGIERTTGNFDAKNNETYIAFDNAFQNNPEKFKEVRDQAYAVKAKTDDLVMYIQEMKYDLVSVVDNEKVYLGKQEDILDEEGKPKEELVIENKKFSDLTQEQKLLPIAYLGNKDNRDMSGELFVPKQITKEKRRAVILKKMIEEYRDHLIGLSKGNQTLINNLNSSFDMSDKGESPKKITWEEYNFVDMPSVGALTLLSKIQSDLRNAESNIINQLRTNLDAKALKFTSAEGLQISKKNYVLKGDLFEAEIFIAAKNESQNPEIYVGAYDSLENGEYKMRGDYQTVEVRNGKGYYTSRASSEGVKKWGGLIAMKTESGTKYYPFEGEYLVANKTAVVSPVKMNVLYLEVDNPVKISVPGFPAADITASITNGSITATQKTLGEYKARPTKTGSATITLFATVEGKKVKMGDVEFRVKDVPPPKPFIGGKSEGAIDKQAMIASGGIQAKLEDFDFEGIRYKVVGYTLNTVYKGNEVEETVNGERFSEKINAIINNAKSGNTISFSNIQARRTDAAGSATRALPPIVLKIK